MGAEPGDATLAWAAWAGQHALALYMLLVATALAAAWVAWLGRSRWRAARRASNRDSARDSGRASALNSALNPDGKRGPLGAAGWLASARIGVGFGVIVAAAWLFAELAEALDAGPRLGRIDQTFTDALVQSVPPAALRMFAVLTHFGDTITLTLLCIAVSIALIARRERLLALGWVAAVAGNALLNTTLKQVFERARPVHADGWVAAPGYSFPSGHSSGSLVAYGMLAYLAVRVLPARWHLPAVLAAVALALSVGASRVFLRVHFASDVLAGFASGAAWWVVCVTSMEVTRWWWRRAR